MTYNIPSIRDPISIPPLVTYIIPSICDLYHYLHLLPISFPPFVTYIIHPFVTYVIPSIYDL